MERGEKCFFYVKCHRRTIFGSQENLKIYAVKNSALTHAIDFSNLTVLKIFNAGAGLGLATPLTTAACVSFFLDKNCAEDLYDHIKQDTFQMRTPASLQHQM